MSLIGGTAVEPRVVKKNKYMTFGEIRSVTEFYFQKVGIVQHEGIFFSVDHC